ncbi:MAG: anaerobic ribonucleoside triphosphate reductase [Clostridiales bacterium]|nr:anaerobic ribonucleoside triphosphate reductase [Clostridiales bacterium]
MIKTIIKRDGREADFDVEKISDAIYKAAKAIGGSDRTMADELADRVVEYVENTLGIEKPGVEQLQDAVEKILVDSGHTRTAKEYILYRAKRSRVREMNTKLMKVYEDLTFKSAKDNNVKRENANIDGDTAMGTMLRYGSEGAKRFYDMFILDPVHAEAHKNGDIHIHDLDFLTLTTTCCQIDLLKLFKGGFSTGHGFLREPNDIASYSALACIAIQSNQNDQHGGQSVPNFDYCMAPGVAKTYKKKYAANLAAALAMISDDDTAADDAKTILNEINTENNIEPKLSNSKEYAELLKNKLKERMSEEEADRAVRHIVKNSEKQTDRATYQAMEALIHNLNTMHSRAGAQIPFSSLNYGTDTSDEGRMVMKNLLLAEEEGLGNGETPIFPIHIFKVKEGINYNKEDKNYDLFKLACRVSAKRLFPNFSFLDAPFNLQYYKEGHPETEATYMGCRTRVVGNYYDKEREITYGRGNLSFTSINLPRIAINANGNIDWFFDELDRKIDLVIAQLLSRYKVQAAKTVKNYPFLMGQGIWIDSDKLKPGDTVGEVLKHGTLTAGFIGLAECLKALTGKHHGESQKSQNLGIEIVAHMRKRMDEATEKYGMNFSLIATPAEGLSGRFVNIDKKKYGVIEGVTDREYYTNSFHIPVYYPISAYDKIKLEAPYHAYTNGGHISYIELDGDPTTNLEAFESVIRYMKESGIGYGSINHPVDRDPVCGYTGIINDTCPKCGRNTLEKTEDGEFVGVERIRRVTGYLAGTIDRFNDAKKAEVRDRVKHMSVNDTEEIEKI